MGASGELGRLHEFVAFFFAHIENGFVRGLLNHECVDGVTSAFRFGPIAGDLKQPAAVRLQIFVGRYGRGGGRGAAFRTIGVGGGIWKKNNILLGSSKCKRP